MERLNPKGGLEPRKIKGNLQLEAFLEFQHGNRIAPSYKLAPGSTALLQIFSSPFLSAGLGLSISSCGSGFRNMTSVQSRARCCSRDSWELHLLFSGL